jgi:DMSO/TMAO reductase YedYZ molybdopterin-dependent catalytic subunit
MRGPPPRTVDWTLFVLVLAGAATGVAALLTGHPSGWWVVAAHAVVGFALAAVLAFKLNRVAPRLRPSLWDRRTVAGGLAATLVVAVLATGVAWSLGAEFGVAGWTGLFVHMALGAVLVVPVLAHLLVRFRPPDRTDLDRRVAVQYAGIAVLSVLALRLQGLVNAALDTAGAARRFTGSRERGSLSGNAFPTTSWVADDPDPVDAGAWTLTVEGAVAERLALRYADLETDAERRALLDCTSGWYSVQDWRGVRVGDLLAAAGASESARWVSFRSVTGYRWSLPLAEAEEALLATHVGGERLSHDHGFPARLVAPDRRGFQWVKWVETVEVRRRPDYGQWVAIFTSGFD